MRLGRRRGTFLALLGIVFFTVIIYILKLAHNYDQRRRCIQHSDELCDSYKNGLLVGNLCSQICQENYFTISCLQIPDPSGKWVLRYLHPANNDGFILKTFHNENLAQFITDQYNYMKDSGILDNVEAARSEMTKLFKGVNSTINNEQVQLFLEQISMHSDTIDASVKSGLRLIQQPEFIASFQYQTLPFVPKLYGTCGDHYAMEALQSTDTMTDSPSSRYRLALSYLNLVQEMEFSSAGSIQLCDVKPANYGLRKNNGELVVLDIDTLFYKVDLLRELEATGSCTQNSDCDFWDCSGICDKQSRKCSRSQDNNNLQAVCRKIFTRSLQRGHLGLLSPSLFTLQRDNKLSQLLEDCINNYKNSAETLKDHIHHLRSTIKEALKH